MCAKYIQNTTALSTLSVYLNRCFLNPYYLVIPMIAAAKNYILLVTDRMNLTGVITTLGRQFKKRIIARFNHLPQRTNTDK